MKIVSGFSGLLLNAGVAPVPSTSMGAEEAVAVYFDPLGGFRFGDQVCERGKYLSGGVVGWRRVRGA